MKRALLTLALLAAPSLASAQRCSRGRAGTPMPVGLTIGAADFGNTPSPCADLRIALDLRATALIDTPDFYGMISGETVLSANLPVAGRFWLSGAWSFLRLGFVQNATLIANELAVGAATVGGHVGLIARDNLRVAAYLRVLLPTDSDAHFSARTGLEPGLTALWRPHRRVSLLGGFSVPVVFSVLGGRGDALSTARASVDVSVLIGTWFEPSLGVELRVGNDPNGALEYVAPRLALRAHLGRGVGIHLSAMAPLGGVERVNARAALGVWVGW